MVLFILIVLILLPIILFFPIPYSKDKRVDAYLILGCPCKDDGSYTASQKYRCEKANECLKKQKVPIIITGSAVKNRYVEAEMMAKLIHSQKIYLEIQARNTFDNFKFAKAIADEHGFRRIGIITSNYHILRSYYFAKRFFDHPVMIGDHHPFSLKHLIREFFALYNTLWWELKLKIKTKKEIDYDMITSQ